MPGLVGYTKKECESLSFLHLCGIVSGHSHQIIFTDAGILDDGGRGEAVLPLPVGKGRRKNLRKIF